MDSIAIVHNLLHLALLEIQAEAHRSRTKRIAYLAETFGPLPLDLLRITGGIGTYETSITSIRNRAEQRSVLSWLDTQIMRARTSICDVAITNESRSVVYKLLYHVLVDIRSYAYEAGNDRIFCLSHLFHNLPLEIELVNQGEGTYDEILARILDWITDDTSLWGCEAWLAEMVTNLSASPPRDSQATAETTLDLTG